MQTTIIITLLVLAAAVGLALFARSVKHELTMKVWRSFKESIVKMRPEAEDENEVTSAAQRLVKSLQAMSRTSQAVPPQFGQAVPFRADSGLVKSRQRAWHNRAMRAAGTPPTASTS